MNFINSEALERNAFLENTQAELETNLGRPELIKALGQQTISRIVDITNRFFVPNTANGILAIPKRYEDTEAIPLLALRSDESIVASKSLARPTPLQQVNATKALQQLERTDKMQAVQGVRAFIQALDNTPDNEFPDIEMSLGGENKAEVKYTFSPFNISMNGISTQFMLRHRPFVVLKYPELDHPHVSLLHESIHVEQYVDEPVCNNSPTNTGIETQRFEFEAYHHASNYGVALYDAPSYPYHGDKELLRSLIVEHARREHHNPLDPYGPTEASLAALRPYGFDWAREDFLEVV